MITLCELAAIQFVKSCKNYGNDYFKAEDLINGKRDLEVLKRTIKILLDLNLLDQVTFDDTIYYKYRCDPSSVSHQSFSIDSEVTKFKRTRLIPMESLLRQVKLMESFKISGEDENFIGLIEKWELASKEVLKELFNHQAPGNTGSMKKFVKKLGLDYDKLGFSEDSEDEIESEVDYEDVKSEQRCNGYSNCNGSDDDGGDNKRIKYED